VPNDDLAILINGLPGSGKSALAARLTTELGWPVISKDALKEGLFETLSPLLGPREIGAIAADLLWDVAARIRGPVILESFWFAERDGDFVTAGLERSARSRYLEVWCEVPPSLAQQRFAARRRHEVHEDRTRLDEWESWRRARPLFRDHLVADTSGPTDVARLVTQILQNR